MCFISTQRYLPMKKFIFKEQPFDRGIFIQGISQAGQKITGNYKPATAEEINKFETELNCSLRQACESVLSRYGQRCSV